MQQELVRLRSLGKVFPGVTALSAVDLSLHAGEIHGLVGENGAGKSTLINILAGVFSPSSGSVEIGGEAVGTYHPSVARALGVAVVFQETVLVPDLSAEANVWLGRERTRFGVLDAGEQRRETQRLCETYHIDIPLSVPVGSFRIAEQKLVEILRALSMEAKVLVLDEPTEAISEKDAENLFRILEALKNQGIGILYVSHHLEEVFRICDRITVLRNGEEVGSYLPADLSVGSLIRLITNREIDEQYPEPPPLGEVRPLLGVEELRSVSAGLDGASLEVGSGEVVALFGMVGSRRSELMKCIFGALPVDSGEIVLGGKKVSFRHPREAMEQGVYLCPEDRKTEGLVLDMSVSDNCTLPFLGRFTRLGVVQQSRADGAAETVAKDLAIKTPSLAQKTSFLSGGNQQKLVIGKWLIGPEGKLFIFDEPTKGVDVGTKREVYAVMQKLARGGAGVIFVSSDIRELLGVTDRLYVMRKGRIVAEYSRPNYDQHVILAAALTEDARAGGTTCD